MTNTYKGDSTSKKLARLMLWLAVKKHLGPKFLTSKLLCLASREGGDISVLLGLGVDPGNILPVERKSDDAKICQERWPDVKVICDDAFNVAEKRAQDLGAAFFDFCGPLDAKPAEALALLARRMRSGSVLAFAGLRSREKNVVIKAYQRRARNREELHFSVNPEFWQTQNVKPGDFDCARVRAVQEHVMRKLWGARVAPNLIALLNYQSNTENSRGVPMTIGALKLTRHVGLTETQFKKIGLALEIQATEGPLSEGFSFFGDYGSSGDCEDRERALALCRFMTSKKAAALLNVSTGTIAAWKANQTRGTYTGQKTPHQIWQDAWGGGVVSGEMLGLPQLGTPKSYSDFLQALAQQSGFSLSECERKLSVGDFDTDCPLIEAYLKLGGVIMFETKDTTKARGERVRLMTAAVLEFPELVNNDQRLCMRLNQPTLVVRSKGRRFGYAPQFS